MRFNPSLFIALLLTLCSCSWNNPSAQQVQNTRVMPTREETVGFFGTIHRAVRDTEQGAYGLMYGIRDGTDNFIYDVQKDYYDGYQK